MKYHYLIGGSGIPNYGDELIASAWVKYINNNRPNDRIILDVQNQKASTSIVLGHNVEHISILKRIATNGAKKSFWDNLTRGIKFLDKNVSELYPSTFPLLNCLDKLTTFHVYGGGYMNDRWPGAAFYLGLGAALKKRTGAKVVATGIGLMPLMPPANQEQERAARSVIEAFDFIEVRDEESVKAFKGTISGLDDVFMVPPPQITTQGIKTLHIAVSFIEHDWDIFARDLVIRIAKEWAPSFDRILFWNCAPQKDLFSLQSFKEAIPEIHVADVFDLVNQPIFFGADDAMIATRFHPHMMAARAGIPGVYRFGNGYYSIKHGSVCALGSGFKVITNSMKSFPNERGTLYTSDQSLMDRKGNLAASIYLDTKTLT